MPVSYCAIALITYCQENLGLFEWPRMDTPMLRCVKQFNRSRAPMLHLDAFQASSVGRSDMIPVGSTAIRLHDSDGAWIGSEISGTFEFKANLTLCGFPGGTITGRYGCRLCAGSVLWL